MKILIVNECARMFGGTERYLHTLIPELVQRGHSVGLVHGDIPDRNAETVISNRLCLSWPFGQLGLQRTIDQVRAWAPDLLYCQGVVSPELEEALTARYPSIFYGHGYYGTCATGSKVHTFPIIRPCSRQLSPMCLLLHLPLRCGGLNPVTTINGYRVQLRRKNILKRHAAVLVANSHMRREFAQNGVDPGKIHVVPLPLDEFNSQLKAPTPKKPSGKLLFMGRLTDLKGVHYLLRAISVAQTKLSFQLALTVAGEGPEEEQLRKAASQMNLKVNFAGWVGQKDLPGLLAQSDLLAVPSVWPEPFGLVGLEAASNGVPAVAFDVGGISSWLKAGVSGELAPGDPPRIDGLADAIVLALSDPNHYNHLRQGAWSFARQFAANHHVQKLESIMVRARSYAAARTQ